MKPIVPFFISVYSILTATTLFQSRAWDNPGHMAVAGIAFDDLTTNQQSRLIQIIGKHPDLSIINQAFPTGKTPTGRDLVMSLATWPDEAKKHEELYQNNGYEKTAPAVKKVEYDGKMHKGWHFIDKPIWVGDGPPKKMPKPPKVNAVALVNVLRQQYGTEAGEPGKAYLLGWLLHLVGDLHQPLHAAEGFSETYPKGDVGGNEVRLAGEKNGEPELHAFWDDALGKSAKGDHLDQDLITANQIVTDLKNTNLGANAGDLKPETWASESFQLAKNDAYELTFQHITVMHKGTPTPALRAELDSAYGDTTRTDARVRIKLAGHRLGLILKQLLN